MKNIILVIIAIVFSGCQEKNKTEQQIDSKSNILQLSKNQLKNINIETVLIGSNEFPYIEKVNGTIDVPPQNLVSISCPTGGYLTETKVLPGTKVFKGEVIAIMTDQQYIQLQQEYLAVKSKIKFAEIEFQRQKVLAENEATSDKVLQQTNAELQQNKILLSSIAEKLKLININPNKVSVPNIQKTIKLYSPINGYINKVNVNIGKYVSPSEVLFEIINPTDIHLNLRVFEKVAQSLKIGQKVMAYSNNNPLKKYECEIILINKKVDSDGTVEVHCHFENFDPSLIVGMYMNAEIEIKHSLNDSLPMDALVNFDGGDFIFVQLNKTSFQMIPVEIGTEQGNRIEIKNAKNLEGKKIVSKGTYNLLMALKNVEE